ncbi:GyrI-like domain-containing protein [Amnibacterium kyonggiense]|uniref:GyrI-like domain-containing protein n=1 Tax=Amnibacterium kyonggiense TaxID=595671 RepID=UPI001060612A|nr:GyrI-like domain-containing protein [Amnibacterium kyonggiense]
MPDATSAVDGLQVHVLPAVDRAAVTVHAGAMASIDRSWQALMDAAAERGETLRSPSREVYLTAGDVPQEAWRTELVQPLGDDPGVGPAR